MSDQNHQGWANRIALAAVAVAFLAVIVQGYYSQQGIHEMKAQREQDKKNSRPDLRLQATRREFKFPYRNMDRGLIVPADVDLGTALNVGNGGAAAAFTRWEPTFWDFEHEHPPPTPPYLDDPDFRSNDNGLDRRYCVPPNIAPQQEAAISHFSRHIANLVPYNQKGMITGHLVLASQNADGELVRNIYPFRVVVTPMGKDAKVEIDFVHPRPVSPNVRPVSR